MVHLPHIANFTDFNALAAQPDVRVRYVRDPQALADADLVILPGSKNTLGDLCWLRESGMAHAVEQARQRKVPLLGICGGYQMLGETIIDEVESGLGAQPGLGVLKTVTHFAQHKTTTQVQATLGSALPDWLADAAGLRVSGYEIHMGETRREAGCPPLLQLHKAGQAVDDGAISDDGLAFGTYLHGLFDSDAFTRALLNGLRQRKGWRRWTAPWSMPAIKPGSLIGWPRPCANISPSIKFTHHAPTSGAPMLTLVTGGARSGKSRHAEALIADAPQVLYIATSQIFDDEMAARIQHHRDGRPAHWRTAERWQQLDELITPAIAPAEAILLECITTMVTNLLFALGGDSDPDGWDYAAMERAIDDEIGVLIAACQRCPAHVVLVTNEVGMGIVPENRLARHFRDIAGRVNQRLAAAADAVWLVVSGIGVKIK